MGKVHQAMDPATSASRAVEFTPEKGFQHSGGRFLIPLDLQNPDDPGLGEAAPCIAALFDRD